MILLNFSHPLTEKARAMLEELAQEPVTIQPIPVQVNEAEMPLESYIKALMQKVLIELPFPIEPEKFVLNLPGYAPAAACVIAQFFAMTERWPRFVYMQAKGTPPVYVPVRIIDLHSMSEFDMIVKK